VSVLDEAFAFIAKAKANAERNLVNARKLFESVLERIFDDGEDWEEKLLGDVCKVAGKLTRDIDSSLPYIGADSIESNSGRLLQKKTVLEQGIQGPVSYFSGKKLLYSKIRPYLNKLSITNFKGYCSSDMYPLEFNKPVLYEFASHYLLSKRFMKSIGGFYERAAIPKINRKQLFSVSFPVPPLAEQRVIVDRLDALSAETKRLEEIYKHKIESLEELKKSVLQKAFQGEL
jgi:restriction endonuclease S subunit